MRVCVCLWPNDWQDAIIWVPIPNNGDLTVFVNNWRNICLLEVVGKVVARVI